MNRRSGTAAVETAVTLPLLLILVFGSIELGNAVFLKQSLNIAAYEAAKVVTAPGQTETQARARCAELLAVRKVPSYTLTFSPVVTASTARGTEITVTVSASSSNISYGPVRFMYGKTCQAVVRMVRL
ncbi:MAG: pilus assembly protein [Planctomyces sp.]|nr:pilus assembly protein [Planctomyces sp.]